MYNLFSAVFLLLLLSMLILSLPLSGLGSQSTLALCSVHVGQGHTIQFVGGLVFFSGFFVSPCLVALLGGINGCGWYLEEGRGC